MARYAGRHSAPKHARTSARTRARFGGIGGRRLSRPAVGRVALVAILVMGIALDHGRGTPSVLAQRPPVHAGGGGTPHVTPASTSKLAWRDCGDADEQCAKVEVPLDYSAPSGRTIDIAINRFPATGAGNARGVLLVNPGGPGASGMQLARELQGVLPPAIRESFDLVGFDPRGVGHSSPVACPPLHVPKDLPQTMPIAPRTAKEQAFVAEEAKDVAENCASVSDWLLPYLGTEYAAHDMDAIREALGVDKISYLGFSYGTVLGATYLSLFPQRVQAMVLDGAAPSNYADDDKSLDQAVAFQKVIGDFLAWCVRDSCPLGSGSVDSAWKGLTDELNSLARQPIETNLTDTVDGEQRILDASEALDAVVGSMYATREWPALKMALTNLVGGDGTALLALDDSYQDRDSNGHPLDNMEYANLAIHCADNATRGQTVAQAKATAQAWQAKAPLLGPQIAWSLMTCSYWMPTKTPPVKYISSADTPPVLVVGASGDPATPYSWAQEVASDFGSARLLTRDGDGHTSYLRGSPCIDTAIDTYLLTRVLPAAGTVCASAPPP